MATVTSATKYFPTAVEGFTTTLASTISSGALTVPLNSVAGYSNGEVVALVIEPTSATKKQVFTGTVDTAGVQITGVAWTEGTNTTHDAGVTVSDFETATAWALQRKGLLVSHNEDGTLKAASVDTAIAAGSIDNAQLASGVSVAKLYNPYKFSVYRSAAFNATAVSAVLPFDTKLFDTGSNVDIVTNVGRFTAPVAGFYCFQAGVYVSAATGGFATLNKNGSSIFTGSFEDSGSTQNRLGLLSPPPIQLSASDYIEVYISADTTRALAVGQTTCYFGGYLLSAT